jgi:hypothetical protein
MASLKPSSGDMKAPLNSSSITSATDADPEALVDGEYGSTGSDHVFVNPIAAEFWAETYEKAKYEGRHRFDIEYKWSAKEEKRLVRKVCRRTL